MTVAPDVHVESNETVEEVEASEALYLVDNSVMMAKTRGLAYRRSKQMDDRDGAALAPWGTQVRGIDQRDGWIKLGSRFLPAVVNGIRILVLQDPNENEA